MDITQSSIELMSMQTRCRVFQQLLRKLNVMLPSGTVKQQLMNIPTKLKELHIDCKRTWFMDIRPCPQIYQVILLLCQQIMTTWLQSNSRVNPEYNNVDELLNQYESEINSHFSLVVALQNQVAYLKAALLKLHEANKNPNLSLEYIRNALQVMNTISSSPFATCASDKPHPKYILDYPQIKEKHPLLKDLMLNGKYNASVMLQILSDCLKSSKIKVPNLPMATTDVGDLNKLIQERDELIKNVDQNALLSVSSTCQLNYFDSIEI